VLVLAELRQTGRGYPVAYVDLRDDRFALYTAVCWWKMLLPLLVVSAAEGVVNGHFRPAAPQLSEVEVQPARCRLTLRELTRVEAGRAAL
jgi:hypothetical protein